MTRYESFLLSPRRKYDIQDLSLGQHHFEDDSAPALPAPAPAPASAFGAESFMSPLPTKYRTPSSPPSLCRERKRVRHNNAFRSSDGSILPQFLIPELGPDHDDDDIDMNLVDHDDLRHGLGRDGRDDNDSLRVRVPLRFRLKQRLVHPCTPTIEKEDDADVDVNRESSVPAPAHADHLSNIRRSPTFFYKIQTQTAVPTAPTAPTPTDLNRSLLSSDKSTDSILIGINLGLDSTSSSGRRMKRRSSSSALSA